MPDRPAVNPPKKVPLPGSNPEPAVDSRSGNLTSGPVRRMSSQSWFTAPCQARQPRLRGLEPATTCGCKNSVRLQNSSFRDSGRGACTACVAYQLTPLQVGAHIYGRTWHSGCARAMRPKPRRPSLPHPAGASPCTPVSFLHRLTSFDLLHDDRFTRLTKGSDRDGAAGSGLADGVEGG
jgi:hypothetical protein